MLLRDDIAAIAFDLVYHNVYIAREPSPRYPLFVNEELVDWLCELATNVLRVEYPVYLRTEVLVLSLAVLDGRSLLQS